MIPNKAELETIKGGRPKGGLIRQAPGKLDLPAATGHACAYEEDLLNTASINCKDNTWPCSTPDSTLAGIVEPSKGACAGGFENVRQLVMVSRFSTLANGWIVYQ